jgi:ribonuclease P protein component
MLSRENRLSREKEISWVYRNGQSYQGQFVNLKVLKNKLSMSRFCFVISNKVAPRAVRRNRVKRQFREIIRLQLGKIKSGIDCLIMAKRGITGLEYRQMEEEIIKLLQKAHLFD